MHAPYQCVEEMLCSRNKYRVDATSVTQVVRPPSRSRHHSGTGGDAGTLQPIPVQIGGLLGAGLGGLLFTGTVVGFIL